MTFQASSIGKTRSALRSAACQYLASVSVRHSLAEAVLLFSVQLLRLIRSQHIKTLLSGYLPLRVIIITYPVPACQHQIFRDLGLLGAFRPPLGIKAPPPTRSSAFLRKLRGEKGPKSPAKARLFPGKSRFWPRLALEEKI